MSIACDLDKHIKDSGDKVFIEAEGKPARLKNFYMDYNSKYSPSINNLCLFFIIVLQRSISYIASF